MSEELINQDELDALFNLEASDDETVKPEIHESKLQRFASKTGTEPDQNQDDGLVSQDELDSLFNLDNVDDRSKDSVQDTSVGGELVNQDELDSLFNLDNDEDQPTESHKAASPDGEMISQDELDALLNGDSQDEAKPAPPTKISGSSDTTSTETDILSQDDLDALFSGDSVKEEEQKTSSPASSSSSSKDSDNDDILTQDDLDSLFDLDDSKKTEKTAEPSIIQSADSPIDDGELISQDELDMLLGTGSSSSASESKTEEKKVSSPPAQPVKPAESKPKVLSQAEIDNMFAGLNLDDDDDEEESSTSGAAEFSSSSVSAPSPAFDYTASSPSSSVYDSGGQSLAQKQYKLYNFRRPEKLSRDQIRLMKPHFEPMTRSVTNYLSMQLKTSIDTNFLDIDQINYGDIFRKLDQSDIIGIFKLYPTPHSGIMEFSTFLFYSIEERMMGGSGKSHTPIRKITDFEKYLVTDLFENFLSAYGDTIRKFVDTNPRVDMVETDKFLIPRTLSDEEVLVRMVYEIYIDGVSGLLKINIPYSFLSTFFSPFRNKQDPTLEKIDSKSVSKNIFSKISVPVSVELKPRKLNVGDLMSLRKGDTIVLSHAYGEELGLKVDNNLKYYCKPGISGNRLAVKITRTAEGDEL